MKKRCKNKLHELEQNIEERFTDMEDIFFDSMPPETFKKTVEKMEEKEK